MYAFLSYQADDKAVAAKIKKVLESMEVPSFLAHEDIDVSEEWRVALLREIRKTDLFIPILSERYYSSPWCVQESGIAVFRKMTIIPLSIDGTIPKGFISHLQSTSIHPTFPSSAPIVAGLAKRDLSFTIDAVIKLISVTGGYRNAEAAFDLVLPYLDRATRAQIVRLLTVSTQNDQVCNAGGCIKPLRTLLKSHGRYMKLKTRKELIETLKRYP